MNLSKMSKAALIALAVGTGASTSHGWTGSSSPTNEQFNQEFYNVLPLSRFNDLGQEVIEGPGAGSYEITNALTRYENGINNLWHEQQEAESQRQFAGEGQYQGTTPASGGSSASTTASGSSSQGGCTDPSDGSYIDDPETCGRIAANASKPSGTTPYVTSSLFNYHVIVPAHQPQPVYSAPSTGGRTGAPVVAFAGNVTNTVIGGWVSGLWAAAGWLNEQAGQYVNRDMSGVSVWGQQVGPQEGTKGTALGAVVTRCWNDTDGTRYCE